MRELILTWGEQEYRCRPTHDVIMHIENKVVLMDLGNRISTGSDIENVPVSHLAWVAYCLLKGAGAPVSSEMVWESFRQNNVSPDMMKDVILFVYSEVFGVGPSDPPESGEGKEVAGNTQPDK